MNKTISILMADDDADDRMLTKSAFEENNISNPLSFVENGVDLMEHLLSNKTLPGLILLDLNMPKKDGREALKEIKSYPQLKKIPVIVLTTSRSEKDVLETYDLGANCFISKPVSFEGLLDVIKHIGNFWLEIATIPNTN